MPYLAATVVFLLAFFFGLFFIEVGGGMVLPAALIVSVLAGVFVHKIDWATELPKSKEWIYLDIFGWTGIVFLIFAFFTLISLSPIVNPGGFCTSQYERVEMSDQKKRNKILGGDFSGDYTEIQNDYENCKDDPVTYMRETSGGFQLYLFLFGWIPTLILGGAMGWLFFDSTSEKDRERANRNKK